MFCGNWNDKHEIMMAQVHQNNWVLTITGPTDRKYVWLMMAWWVDRRKKPGVYQKWRALLWMYRYYDCGRLWWLLWREGNFDAYTLFRSKYFRFLVAQLLWCVAVEILLLITNGWVRQFGALVVYSNVEQVDSSVPLDFMQVFSAPKKDMNLNSIWNLLLRCTLSENHRYVGT